ncbi:tetratricopeptide repeat protein [Longispora sp. K20-0274]|uniref:ATP-binding protein n=1 Tax=Longispora sp. K20-0274 TaxID=3088255 RepID=UPI00399B3DFD
MRDGGDPGGQLPARLPGRATALSPADGIDPAVLTDPVAFLEGLRALKVWAGDPSLRDLQRRTGLPRSTLADALSTRRTSMPRLEVVMALVRAFAPGDAAVAAWERAWRVVRATPVTGDSDAQVSRAPAQLPADITDFTGRAAQVAGLEAALRGSGPGTPVVVVSAVTGAGGVGKTSLAVHVGHRSRAAFPGGQLYADLRGTAPVPATAGEVLGRFLRDLGADPATVPAQTDDRAAAYRTLLAGRRILVVLDDAAGVAQVRPLLPGTADCALLVTSRNRLAGLDGAHRVGLDTLDDAEARALFERVVGARALDDPAATDRVLRACAGLPLAVRLAAGRLVEDPTWTVATLADRLDDQAGLLDELRLDDRAVRVTLAVGHRQLPAEAARAFALLGLWDGVDIELDAAAALLDRSGPETEAVLRGLTGTHLLGVPVPGRFAFHDLVRVYAAERAAEELTPAERGAAVGRLVAWYRHRAASAALVLNPRRRHVPLDGPPVAFTDHAAAWAWTDGRYDNLVAAVRLAADHGLHEHAWKVAHALWDAFNIRSAHADWIATGTFALAAARAADDPDAEAWTLNNLGTAYARASELDTAAGHMLRAAELYHRLGDRSAEAGCRGNLAFFDLNRHRFASAIEQLLRVKDLFVELGDPLGVAHCLDNLGAGYFHLGDFPRALEYFQEGYTEHLKSGNRFNEGKALTSIARTLFALDRLDEAEAHAREALDVNRAVGNGFDLAMALGTLGDAHAARGRMAAARDCWAEAHGILLGLGQPEAEEMSARLSALPAT